MSGCLKLCHRCQWGINNFKDSCDYFVLRLTKMQSCTYNLRGLLLFLVCFQEMDCSTEKKQYFILLALHREVPMAFISAADQTQVSCHRRWSDQNVKALYFDQLELGNFTGTYLDLGSNHPLFIVPGWWAQCLVLQVTKKPRSVCAPGWHT